MFRDLKYYKELSKQLDTEIAIYESSYQDFERVIDFSVRPDKLNRDQRKVLDDFIDFYQGEGIYNKGLTKSRYPKIRETIIERVNFLKEQKTIIDRMIKLHEELESLKKKDGLDSSIVKKLKETAAVKYDPGTRKYNNYLNDLMDEYRNTRTAKVKDEIETVKEQHNKIKKENNLGKVASNVFGPFGNNIYNAWARVHNFNVRNLRKHKAINFLVKGSMVLLFAAIVANLSLAGALSPFLVVAGMGITVVGAVVTIKHSLPSSKIPSEVEYKKGLGSLKENWFKFKKSRGMGVVNVNEHFYEGVDFSKYDATKTEKLSKSIEGDKTFEKKMESEVEPELEDKKDDKIEVPAFVSDEKDVVTEEKMEEIPKLPAPSYERYEPVIEEKEESTVESSLEAIEEPALEERIETTKEETRKKTRTSKKVKVDESLPNVDSGIDVNSLGDVTVVLKKFQDHGINTVDDWYTLRNVRLFLGRNFSKTGDRNYLELRNMFDELAKKMPKELRDKIAIARTFGNIDTSNRRKSIATKVKDETKKYRQQELTRIAKLIQNSSAEDAVMEEVNNFFNHYDVSGEERRYIQDLLKEKEEKTVDSIRRKG